MRGREKRRQRVRRNDGVAVLWESSTGALLRAAVAIARSLSISLLPRQFAN